MCVYLSTYARIIHIPGLRAQDETKERERERGDGRTAEFGERGGGEYDCFLIHDFACNVSLGENHNALVIKSSETILQRF